MTKDTQAYQWAGIDSHGNRKNGVIQAGTPLEAQSELKKQGIEIISIKTKRVIFRLSREKKIKHKDILLFTRYLATMLAAGIPIIQAFDIIAHDQENPSMQSVVTSLRMSVASGKTMSESFNQYPHYFGELYCNLISAGEKSGTLDKILERLAVHLEKTESMRKKIKKALTYPTAIVVVALVVSAILLLFVVPQFKQMFQSFGADLPFFTRMVVNLSEFLQAYWWIILGVMLIGGYGLFVSMRRSAYAAELRDRMILKIMIIGPLLRKGIVARFARTLATTLDAGMPIVEALQSGIKMTGNKVYSTKLLKVCDDVASGKQLNVSLAATKLFPNMVIQMIAIGEASGSLAGMLNKVADYYEEEVNHVVDNLSSLLEPLIMLLLGVIIGSFVVAMYLPIFKIGTLI